MRPGLTNVTTVAGPDGRYRCLHQRLRDLLLGPAQAGARIEIEGDYRVIHADGNADHATGTFPNDHNPNRIEARAKTYRVPAAPQYRSATTALGMWPFGVALNGIPFDPGAAEYWNRDRRSGWQYEAMGGAVDLGLDSNHAHVQPDGTYHYHALPTALLTQRDHGHGPVLLGYAADGFPVYGSQGYRDAVDADSGLAELRSGYAVRSGQRPAGPGGNFDGAFVEDYAYGRGRSTLDACNGRNGVTPEYPNGTYYYVITKTYPFIPRCFHGTPDRSFMRNDRGPTSDQAGRLQGHGQRGGPSGGGPSGHTPPAGRTPPREAFEACRNASAGAGVTFRTPRGDSVRGICREHGGELFAVPAR